MIYLITGSRNPSKNLVKILNDALADLDLNKDVIVEGGAKGIDNLAWIQWHKNKGGQIIRVPACWGIFGKGAGPIRNRLILDKIKIDTVLAFPMPDSKGTFDCINYAKKCNINVITFKEDGTIEGN